MKYLHYVAGAIWLSFSVSLIAETLDNHPGRIKSDDERCQECHGSDGNIHANNQAGKIPKLAGQKFEYLVKQFSDFRNGDRQHDFMSMMAKTVDEADASDILDYYSRQPMMKGNGSANNLLGKSLFLKGDPGRGIQACVTCHGVDGKGVVESADPNISINEIPVIGGQDWFYLEQQLLDWRSGTRSNSQDAVMNKVVAKLTDQELIALVDYISGL
jgi:cytochrome c553